MTANVAGYLLQLLAGRWLGVGGYSEFASLLAVQLLCAVPALALQNVVAREIVQGAGMRAVRSTQLRCAGLVAVAAAVLVPIVSTVLNVGVWAAAGALSAAPVLVLVSGEQGILQGHNKFRALAVVLAVAGSARVAPALCALAVGGTAATGLWAATGGIAVAAVIAGRIARGSERGGARAGSATVDASGGLSDPSAVDRPRARDVSGLSWTDQQPEIEPQAVRGAPELSGVSGREHPGLRSTSDMATASTATRRVGVVPVLRAVQVQAALMALSSADLIVSRIVLDPDNASRYALGAIATKIAFWLPAAVGVVLYPRMAQPAHSARAIRDALTVLVGIGTLAVIGAAIAAPLAPLFAGSDYAPIQGLLWMFALDGAILAVLQGAMLSAIAVERTALAVVTWIGLVVEVVAMLTVAHSINGLITTAVCVAGVTTAIVVVAVLRTGARTVRQPE
nr:polysaccharide biosynthesis protein [Nocardia camponoti]